MLSVANKPFMLSVVMLSAIMPIVVAKYIWAYPNGAAFNVIKRFTSVIYEFR